MRSTSPSPSYLMVCIPLPPSVTARDARKAFIASLGVTPEEVLKVTTQDVLREAKVAEGVPMFSRKNPRAYARVGRG